MYLTQRVQGNLIWYEVLDKAEGCPVSIGSPETIIRGMSEIIRTRPEKAETALSIQTQLRGEQK